MIGVNVNQGEYRFAWWHQGLLMYDQECRWSSDSHEISDIDFSHWLAQDPTRAVTIIAPGGDLFGSSDAPLTLQVLDVEPPVDPGAESVADFDLLAGVSV
jgi:hypothetical protein